MAQNAANIHVGAARIWIGGVVPTTGTPPSLSVHTSGAPTTPQTGFTEVGHTFEDAVWSYQGDIVDIESEQVFGVADTYPTGQKGTLTFTAQERVYIALKTAFDAIGTVDDGSKTLFYGGGIYTVASQVVILTSPRRDNTAKFEVLTIYKAQSVAGIQLAYSRKNPSRYKVELRAIHDSARNAGDQLFQWFREK
jgi:hypothetical protein